MTKITDVALKANVSIATVSRVVNNSAHKVHPATRDRVLRAVRELDFHPNALAKGLPTRKTLTIGIIIPDISNPYYSEIVRGIQDVADKTGYSVTLQNTDGKKEGIVRSIYLLREKSADGVIFSGGIISGFETLSILRELKERVVVIGRHDVDFPAVTVDNIGGATQAAQHLIDLGHSAIGFIGGQDGSTTSLDRQTGYRNALAQNGLKIQENLIRLGSWDPRSGYIMSKSLLRGKERPTAIVAANDQMAFGAVKAAKELGLSVPGDLAVTGFDDIPLSSYFDPPLTTVAIPIQEIGAAAMRMLVGRISGGKFEKFKVFNTKLIVRGSTVRE
ncbi:MAG: LacI family DNA-binding transcriptional regulator [Thermodesulfobacteriota bacterium]